MRIKKINLFTNQLALERQFYSQTLEFEFIQNERSYFTVKIGWTELSFTESEEPHFYHYCFLIPSNKLKESLNWIESKTNTIEIDKGRKIQHFENWNADSFYFYDASGNLAECIVRYDLNNGTAEQFQGSNVLCINEIGVPTNNINRTNSRLNELIGTSFWKGDLNRFGTNGSQEGLFLLPNFEQKKNWFPTTQMIKCEPLEIIVENQGKEHYLKVKKEGIEKLQRSLYMRL